jgi:hypothetical protein
MAKVTKQIKNVAAKSDGKHEVEKLLKLLAAETNKMEKRRIRRRLRSLGHRGGLKNSKFTKSKEKVEV